MKEKYADQDEDEREMRMQLLGAKKVKGFESTMANVQKKAFTATAPKTQEAEEVVEPEEV